ncbi:proline-rich protein 4-like [Senna tora]|uniref:Proline-rich protein 4-like n=1 Tax=Senna tora TaxID=362788 RepID=A0A834SV09_9FABA|nr:proline-rich protein 4-like [Senna tora]
MPIASMSATSIIAGTSRSEFFTGTAALHSSQQRSAFLQMSLKLWTSSRNFVPFLASQRFILGSSNSETFSGRHTESCIGVSVLACTPGIHGSPHIDVDSPLPMDLCNPILSTSLPARRLRHVLGLRQGAVKFCFLVCVLFVVSSDICYGTEQQVHRTAEVVGIAECADCSQNDIKTIHAFSGLGVTIECKTENGHFKTRGGGELDDKGNFKITVPHEIVKNGELKEECYAQLHSASSAPCAAHDGLENSKIVVFNSKTSDQDHHKLTLKPFGTIKFSSVTCTSAFLWPFFNYPPLPKLPPLTKFHHPLIPKLPPLHFGHHFPFPHHKIFPPFPPKILPPPTPTYEKPPCPPTVPVYTPPPTPIYEKPPPVPVYTPPPTPIYEKPPPVPVYTPPPVPIYKKPPPTPIYQKPPPVPIYKKPPPVPVYTPPPVPIYKKPPPLPLPPPVPEYKPPCPPPAPKKPCPPPVPIVKKPCPPIPKVLPPIPKVLPPIPKVLPPIPKVLPPIPKVLPPIPKVLPPIPKVFPPYIPIHKPPFFKHHPIFKIPHIPIYKKPLPPFPKLPPFKKPLHPLPKFPPFKKPLHPLPKFPPFKKPWSPLPPLPKFPPKHFSHPKFGEWPPLPPHHA